MRQASLSPSLSAFPLSTASASSLLSSRPVSSQMPSRTSASSPTPTDARKHGGGAGDALGMLKSLPLNRQPSRQLTISTPREDECNGAQAYYPCSLQAHKSPSLRFVFGSPGDARRVLACASPPSHSKWPRAFPTVNHHDPHQVIRFHPKSIHPNLGPYYLGQRFDQESQD